MKDRFVVGTNEIGEIIVTDVQTDRVYRYDDPSKFFGLIRLLNEQQATIDEIEKNFDDLVEWASKIANRNVILDEQIGQLQRENEQLRLELKEKEEDEQLYANEIVKLNKEAKEVLDFKSLGGNY